MSVAVKNLPAFDAKVKAWFDAVRGVAEIAAKGIATRALEVAARNTPQYSGTTAANWKVNVGSIDASWDRDPLGTKGEGPVAAVGDRRAIGHAISNAEGKLAGFKLGETIYVSNSTVAESGTPALSDFSLSIALEEGQIKLREVNRSYFDMTKRAVRLVSNHYRVIGKAQIAALRKFY